jgi:hypothetical protein
LFESICIQEGTALDLTSSSGKPTETNQYGTCNGVTIPAHLPVCCPPGFFVADRTGCRYCWGNVFTLTGYQICCKTSEYFNVSMRVCLPCNGQLDSSGQLCCPLNNYISYDTSGGTSSCVLNCSLDNVYQSKFCCPSMTQKCSLTLVATTCNPSYMTLGACRGCPTFCGESQLCAQSAQAACNMTCGPNQLQYQGLGCLECDQSCSRCTKPIDSSACLSCAQGYTFVQSVCQACDASCLTCSQFTASCTSCPPSRVLLGSSCV